ncbi:hypothetical protein QTP70_016627 [Hemibagrus guttatus]|uniref:UDP-N-acetylglucosamine transferase subunit ALG14 n=1 Tax=Hemibagrus guttatus TaxID=175788 RepID=A0AAE0VA36_9TELE|nr:hypothetical protein QTP70_016627 [Hemibagrus guttatus]
MFVSAFCGVLCGAFLVVMLFLLRLITILRTGAECKPAKNGSVCVLIVAGSGGHTTEIIRLMGSLSQSYTPRHYVIADTDKMSEEKIRAFEASKEKSSTQAQLIDQSYPAMCHVALFFVPSQFTVHRIPRSREVRQSWSSSVLSTLYSQLYSLPLVFRLRPDMPYFEDKRDESFFFLSIPYFTVENDVVAMGNCEHSATSVFAGHCHAGTGLGFLAPVKEKSVTQHLYELFGFCLTLMKCQCSSCLGIPIPNLRLRVQVLCNGPGTCIPLCTAGLLLGILGLKRVLLVYVESICRVESLSLSGKILYHFADYFFVQWKPLQAKYPKSIYIGRIV